MGKKLSGWKTKGMNRDMSVSAFNNEFAYENLNLRLATNENNTLMSWVNEKGTKLMTLNIEENPWREDDEQIVETHTIKGTPIGTAVINHKLVLFTTYRTGDNQTFDHYPDYIYTFEFDDTYDYVLNGKIIYKGNLNFCTTNPLETLVSYEANYIEKVYWIDNRNQPRIINIASPKEKMQIWNSTQDNDVVDTFFDFVPAIKLNEEVTITKDVNGSGTYAPGVIQYAFTYINKYAQESNIFYVSPLYYLSHADRGASPEERVSCSFSISIEGLDNTFDIVRIYSIQRTSLDLDPIVKQIEDIPIAEVIVGNSTTYSIFYIDNGTTGSTVDPYKLLYVGGKEIQALTMTQKDNTLFLGNIQEHSTLHSSLQEHFYNLRGTEGAVEINFDNYKKVFNSVPAGFYYYNNFLKDNARQITTFKGGEIYRFGFQLQKSTGEWTEPIFIDDKKNTYYPKSYLDDRKIELHYATATLNLLGLKDDFDNDILSPYYIGIRPVIVYPNIQDRDVICQGVLNPTVFNAVSRISGTPYSQASWFFRPYYNKEEPTYPAVEDFNMVVRNITVDAAPINPESTDPESIDDSTPTSSDTEDTKKVYLLEATFTESDYIGILQRGYLEMEELIENYRIIPNLESVDQNTAQEENTVQEENNDNEESTVVTVTEVSARTTKVYFSAINITDISRPRTFVFIKDTPWKEVIPSNSQSESSESSTSVEANIISRKYIGLKDIKVLNNIDSDNNTDGWYIYDGLQVGYVKLLRYKTDELEPTPHVFQFNDDENVFTITFNPISGSTYVSDVEGAMVTFNHYATINQAGNASEIQGSSVQFASAFVQDANTGGLIRHFGDPSEFYSSNSQFFVDQSIVTLNSPDLEFDTTVQRLDMSNLHLRVVGTIPITANAFDYKILTSSSMLELGRDPANAKNALDPDNPRFGVGEIPRHYVINNHHIKAARRILAADLWEDSVIVQPSAKHSGDENTDRIYTAWEKVHYTIYPWHRLGSLNNDWRKEGEATSMLKTKKESTLLFSAITEYVGPNQAGDFQSIDAKVHFAENAEVVAIKVARKTKYSNDITYYPNIDTVLYNTDGYYPKAEKGTKDIKIAYWVSNPDHFTIMQPESIWKYTDLQKLSTPVQMKYKSNTHAIISLCKEYLPNISNTPNVLPYFLDGQPSSSEHHTRMNAAGWMQGATSIPNTNKCLLEGTTFWGDNVRFVQDGINCIGLETNNYGFLWIGELYRTNVNNRFGGNSIEAIRNNNWLVAGNTVKISSIPTSGEGAGNVTLEWTDGDTYYQRYDCLKTYPYTPEDSNQIVEMLSFMCETHVNIDGRFDNKRGQIKNYNNIPENFNILNPVYSQKNNYFSYKIPDKDKNSSLRYPNYISYSETKNSGSDVDAYTHVTLASILELEGDKGPISSLQNLSGQILSFQENGIAQILYNENYQIQTTQGVPIEIANSGKVQGSRYLSNTVGCSNKWSIVQTPSGIYFMDSDEQSIYLFNGQLNNISTSGGMNTWCKQNIPSIKNLWTPDNFKNFVSYYDPYNQDVMFINEDTALAFSEKLNAFTSFYDYGKTPYFCSLDNTGLWVRNSRTGNDTDTYNIYKHQAGDYCKFFGENRPYHTILVGNPEPQTDKIFTNLEFRATVDGDGTYNSTTEKFTPALPFDYLEAWNEYQHGITKLKHKSGTGSMSHNMNSNPSTLKRKFRMWRCDIPRDNTPASTSQSTDDDRKYTLDSKLGISRYNPRKLDRIRNPWVYIKLLKEAAPTSGHLKRAEIHDILMTFFS